ncbi:MAG: orotidine-5'-phosphate decarboxylase [Syntrophobacteraceae bacterium]|jgi:orotidine-5'-phosphate decarboxylase
MQRKDIPLNERIIFALDVGSSEEAQELVIKLEGHIKFYKVGLQLFLASWFHIIDWITGRGLKVMADLKFFDVPETIKLAVRQLKDRGVTFITVHGNDPILKAAVDETREKVEGKNGLKILAVTLLTSFGEEDMKEFFGKSIDIEEYVFFRAKRALEVGCDGVISSGLEARRLRDDLGDNFLIVTPGIRPGANVTIEEDDQKRIVTAGQAIANGADYVVIGRPIRNASDPIAIVELIQREIEQSLANQFARIS